MTTQITLNIGTVSTIYDMSKHKGGERVHRMIGIITNMINASIENSIPIDHRDILLALESEEDLTSEGFTASNVVIIDIGDPRHVILRLDDCFPVDQKSTVKAMITTKDTVDCRL